jgi:uncharacterized membrane protein YeiH
VAETQGTGLLIFGLQMAATMVCAVGGALAAGRKRLDVVGVVFVSFVAAVGGGSLRDLLLDRNPVFWLAQPSYLTVSLIAGALTWVFVCRWRAPGRVLDFIDAFGLGLFTISGIQIAQEMGQSLLICLVMGVITGVAGGLFRVCECLAARRGGVFSGGNVGSGAQGLCIDGGWHRHRPALSGTAIGMAVAGA